MMFRKYKLKRRLARIEQDMQSVLSLPALQICLSKFFIKNHAMSLSLYIRKEHEQAEDYFQLINSPAHPGHPDQLAATHALVTSLSHQWPPLIVKSTDKARDQDLLNNMSCCAVLGCSYKQQLCGIILIAEEQTKTTFNANECTLFNALGRQVGAFIYGCRPYEKVRSEIHRAQRLAACVEVMHVFAHDAKYPMIDMHQSTLKALKQNKSTAEIKQILDGHMDEGHVLFSQLGKIAGIMRCPEKTLLDLNNIVKLAMLIYPDKTIRFIPELEKLPQIDGVKEDLLIVFFNLFDNAVNAMANSEEKLIECATVYNKKIRQIEMRVTDNGIGMNAADQAALFAPFHGGQVKPGLLAVKRIMQEHNGMVYAESAPSGGLTIHLHFFIDS